jgi:hypothetical protein
MTTVSGLRVFFRKRQLIEKTTLSSFLRNNYSYFDRRGGKISEPEFVND